MLTFSSPIFPCDLSNSCNERRVLFSEGQPHNIRRCRKDITPHILWFTTAFLIVKGPLTKSLLYDNRVRSSDCPVCTGYLMRTKRCIQALEHFIILLNTTIIIFHQHVVETRSSIIKFLNFNQPSLMFLNL